MDNKGELHIKQEIQMSHASFVQIEVGLLSQGVETQESALLTRDHNYISFKDARFPSCRKKRANH
jgi:hypothetical protein